MPAGELVQRKTLLVTDVPDLRSLVGCQVTRICLDHQVHLLLAGHDEAGRKSVSATLLVECAMTLTHRDQSVAVNPDTAAGYDWLTRILRLIVASINVEPDGTLEMHFTEGTSLTAVPDPHLRHGHSPGRVSRRG